MYCLDSLQAEAGLSAAQKVYLVMVTEGAVGGQRGAGSSRP